MATKSATSNGARQKRSKTEAPQKRRAANSSRGKQVKAALARDVTFEGRGSEDRHVAAERFAKKLSLALRQNERLLRLAGGDRLLALTNRRAILIGREGQRSLRFKEIVEVAAAPRPNHGKLMIQTDDEKFVVSKVQPRERAAEVAELIHRGLERGGLTGVPLPKRVSNPARRKTLDNAIREHVKAGFVLEQQGDHEAVLSKGGFRVHHGWHGFATVATQGVWGMVWGAQAMRGKERRLVITVDEWGRVTTRQRRFRAPSKRSARYTTRRFTESAKWSAYQPAEEDEIPPGHKPCPECAEYVKTAARICKHCRHRF